MVGFRIRFVISALALWLAFFAALVSAAIVQTGNVVPDVNGWTSGTTGYIGSTSDGSVLIDGGSSVYSEYTYLGYNAGVMGMLTVAGTASNFISSDPLYVGRSGEGELVIEAGGKVRNSYSYLGFNPGSVGVATATGAGSLWNNSESLVVGYGGSGTLTIESGAQVSSTNGSLGSEPGSSGAVTVFGPSSKWTSTTQLSIGLNGDATLTVADGGEVVTAELRASLDDLYGNGTITSTKGAILDTNLVFDSTHGTQQSISFGSTGTLAVNWNAGTLGVGYRQSGSLLISDGVSVDTNTGYLGYRTGSTGMATVTGVGSRWNNTGSLSVGVGGDGTLTVVDGGEVVTGTLYASLNDLLGDGTIAATKGAVLDGDLVFDAAHGNQYAQPFGSGGTLTVTASGGTLGAGYKDSGTLTIDEGVSISSGQGILGYQPGSTGVATIRGAGAEWRGMSYLNVGMNGAGILSVEDGAKIGSYFGIVGEGIGANGVITVKEAGSQWTNSSELYVGGRIFGSISLPFYEGTGTLNIEAGGEVTNSTGYLGASSGSVGTATVTGEGSTWTNKGALYVGNYVMGY